MSKCIKTILSVILSHSGCSDSPKRKIWIDQMTDRIIDTHTARRHPFQNELFCRSFFRKQIQRKWFCSFIHKTYCIFQLVVWQNRQYRTEQFFLHRRRILILSEIQNGRLDITLQCICPSSAEQIFRILLQYFLQTFHMPFIYNPAEIWILFYFFSI